MAKFKAQNEQDESQERKREDRVTLVYDRTSSMKSLEESPQKGPRLYTCNSFYLDGPQNLTLKSTFHVRFCSENRHCLCNKQKNLRNKGDYSRFHLSMN